jgi:hypothetical protein
MDLSFQHCALDLRTYDIDAEMTQSIDGPEGRDEMSGSTERRTSGASEKPGGPNVLFTWPVAQRMLPLVGQIVRQIREERQHLDRMQAEKEELDRLRKTLAWPLRSRRYQLQEEIGAAEQKMQSTLAELEGLGVTLVDVRTGQVGFPTTVNNRPAFFSWRCDEEALQFWNFAEDTNERRPIPASWMKAPEGRRRGSSGKTELR